jgi:glycosyltransferase involved in cell wall biosynthesis
MRVLVLHNRYQQAGGEDVVVQAERELLVRHRHDVELFEADNTEIAGLGDRMRAALGTVYSLGTRKRVAARITSFQPDLVHTHNFFPLLSPSVYYACHEASVPVVQTLHNYRLICPNAQLLRDGNICEDCLGKSVPWPGVVHACYRGSRMGTAAVAMMISVHRRMGTWANVVDEFVALTDFSRNKLIEGGLPAEKITVKPNFVADPGSAGNGRGGIALFIGRLSAEKGVTTLLSAWERLNRAIPLKVAGDGPLADQVRRALAHGSVEYLGAQPRERVQALMRDAAFLVFPSVWYEGLPMVIIEAFSVGLPVIASNLGSMASLVEHGRTGLHFRAGDAGDLAAKVEWAVSHPEEMARMRRETRAEYLAKYTPERNYEMLMEIYGRVTGKKQEVKTGLSHSEIVG